MTQEPTQQTAPEQSDTPEVGSLDAAALAFQQREEPQPEADEPATDEVQDDDPNAEAEEGQPDEDTAEPELEEVEIEGVKFSVPKEQAEAVRKATLRQADYSRKMNDLSAKEKAASQRIEQAEKLVEGATKHAEALAEVRLIESRIKQFEGINWQQLRQENPAEYAAYAADLQSLRLAQNQAQQRVQAVGQEVEQSKGAALAEKRAQMHESLSKSLPGWGDQMGQELTQYALPSGTSFDTLKFLTDPAIVVALDKARKFDALQAAKTDLKAKVKTAQPVLRPGAPKAKQAPQDQAMTELRKFKTRASAEVAFLARMK